MRAVIATYLLLLLKLASAQSLPAFIPLDDDKIKPIESMFINDKGELVYLSIDKYMGFGQAGLSIGKWNGLFNSTLPVYNPELFYYGDENLSSVCLMDDTIYAAASFVNGNKSGIVKWNGTNWIQVGGGIWSDYAIHPEISIEDMLPHEGKLYVCGTFNKIQAGNSGGFVCLSAGAWSDIPTNGKVLDLESIGDTLIACGSFNSLDGTTANNIAMLVNGTWQSIPNPGIGVIFQLGKIGNQLVAVGESGVASYYNGTWKVLSNQWNFVIEKKGSSAELNNDFYISGTFKHTDGGIHHLLRWDGNAWQSILKKEDIKTGVSKKFLVASNGQSLYFCGKFKAIGNEKVFNAIEIFPNHTIVKGKLYNDKNMNCVFDAGDTPIPNAILSIDKDNYFTSTDANGDYKVAMGPGAVHTLEVFPADNETLNCGTALITVNTGLKDSQIIRDFVFSEKPLPPQENIRLFSDRGYKVKHGFDANYHIELNARPESYPFILTLEYPDGLSGFNSEFSIIDDTLGQLSWYIESAVDLSFSFNINPIHFNLGDVLDFKAYISKPDGKRLESELTQTVVSAYDPNDKQCNESRIGTGTRSLDYRIGFQNLGNDDATNVYVVDTISRSIPLQYLKVRNYSHNTNYNVSFKVKDHAVVWGFKDINLGAKSIVGDALSSGFIEFNCGLENNLKIGDSISNQAAIYFDFQAPVFTNRVVTRVVTHTQPDNRLGLNLELYPNPNSGTFTLNLTPYDIQKVEIFDLSGKLIGSYQGDKSGRLIIETEGLSAGIYMVKVHHALGVLTRQFVLAQ